MAKSVQVATLFDPNRRDPITGYIDYDPDEEEYLLVGKYGRTLFSAKSPERCLEFYVDKCVQPHN